MLTQCRTCQATVDAALEGEYSAYDPELHATEFYYLGKCPRCESPFLLNQTQWVPGGVLSEAVRIYPPNEDSIGQAVPAAIREAFGEASKCFYAKSYTASAIMCRKTLEGVCADHKAEGKSLQARLKSLKDLEVIEGRLYGWADELRLVGNEAAHDVAVSVDANNALDTLGFTRAVLEYVYTFRDRFEEFKKRRASRATASASTAPQS